MNFRVAGGKLVFLDVVQDGHMVQGICNQGLLDTFAGVTKSQFKNFLQKIQRGDFICKCPKTLIAVVLANSL